MKEGEEEGGREERRSQEIIHLIMSNILSVVGEQAHVIDLRRKGKEWEGEQGRGKGKGGDR
jgi:hypothetical protein